MHKIELTLLIYFIYGLAFFIMGLVILLEYWRLAPDAPQKRLFLPLAAFGLLHGLHEWLEILLITLSILGEAFSLNWAWVRLGLLSLSFLALAIYAYRAFHFGKEYHSWLATFGMATLPLFALVAVVDVISAFASGSIPLNQLVESLLRYLVGVPAAAVAAIGLRSSAHRARSDRRRPLDNYLNFTAVGFAVYSLTQLFVPSMKTNLASILNTATFLSWVHIPIPVFRILAGVIITIGLFFVTNFLEKERQKIVADAQKARLQALEKEEEARRILLRQTVVAQEEERARIARELHDEMAQTLTAFSLDLATLQQELDNHPKYRSTLDRLQELGKHMSLGIQRMIRDLRPTHLDDLGLVPALKFLSDQARSQFGLDVLVETGGSVLRLDPAMETAIYRIVQESLTNIARHAGTHQGKVNLEFAPEIVTLQIYDAGIGFDPDQPIVGSGGWGLVGMRERAEAVGGTLVVRSRTDEGTLIEAEFPVLSVREENTWKTSD